MSDTWPWLTLADVLVPQSNRKLVQQGWSPKCHPEPAAAGEWGVLKTTAIQAGRFHDSHHKALPEHLEPRPQIEVLPGDLLITCAGPRSRCGVPALVRRTRSRLLMSGKMYRFRPDERLDPRFLELWLLSPNAQSRIDAMKTGISDSGLNLTHARFVQLPVPVPEVAVQRRIVEMLEDHFSRLDAASRDLEIASKRLRSWSDASVERRLSAEGAETRAVADLLREPMRNGRSDRAVDGGKSGTRTLTLTAVTKNQFDERYTKLTSTTSDMARGLWLEPGDILVQRSNTPELVGTAARYDGPSEWAIFPDLLIRLRSDESLIDSRFLSAALRSRPVHRALRKRAKGLAGSMPKIDQAAIGEALVPVPDLDRQRAIVAELAEVTERASALTAEVERAHARQRNLRRALLRAAFSGQLTGHASDLERAEELVDA